jgi:hypothetical protein
MICSLGTGDLDWVRRQHNDSDEPHGMPLHIVLPTHILGRRYHELALLYSLFPDTLINRLSNYIYQVT